MKKKEKTNSENKIFIISNDWALTGDFEILSCYLEKYDGSPMTGSNFVCAEIDRVALKLRVHDFSNFGIKEFRGDSVEALKVRAFFVIRGLGYVIKNPQKLLTSWFESVTIS